MTRVISTVATLALALMNVTFAVAQVSTGMPPFGSFLGGPFDTINLGNLNVHFAVPVVHRAGRAGFNFTYDLGYDSSVWYPVSVSGQLTWQPVVNWGWHFQTESETGFITYTTTDAGHACFVGSQYYGEEYIYSNWTYHDTAGAAHTFAGSAIHYAGAPAYCPPDQYLTATSDGWTLTSSNLKLVGASGQTVYPPVNITTGAASKYDANGNTISVDGSGNFYDTLSSSTPALTVSGSGTSTSPYKFGYIPPANEATKTRVYVQASYVLYTVKTNFSLSPTINEYGPTAVSLLDNITLADGSKYSFTYESTSGTCTPLNGTTACVTARIQSVQLPTGGTITYLYSGGANGSGIFSDGSAGTLTRALSPGGSWTYARSQVSGSHWQTTITDPSTPSNQTQIDFQAALASNFYETRRLVYQGSTSSGALLSTTWNCYNGNSPDCTGTAITTAISAKATYLYLPDSSGQQSKTLMQYDTNNQVTGVYEYDYGPSQVGALLRFTGISYGTANSSGTCSALGNGIADHVCSIDFSDGAGHHTSQTLYSYDETAATAPLGTTPQHVAVTGSRGNLTTLRTVVNGTTSLYRKFTNYDTGNVKTATDAGLTSSGGSNITTYNYPDATSTCGNAFPVSVSEPLTLSRSFTWDCVGAVGLTATDENTVSSTSHYADANFWRPDYVLDQLQNKTTVKYTGQTAVETNLSFNNANSVSDLLVTVDGFGRPMLTQQAQTPALAQYDSAETDYNNVGQPSRSTVVFPAAAGVTNSYVKGITTVYDALGRPTLVTDGGGGTVSYSYVGNDVLQTVGPTQNFKKQFEYDGSGRLTSVCEITAGTSLWPGGTCGQTNPQTGYWTKYTYDTSSRLIGVTQNAQASSNHQTRGYAYDYAGRLTSETNPESGTVNYTYDVACTTTAASTGDLTKRVDNAGNPTCYGYDALHRLANAGYSGPTCRHFKYDAQTPPSGITIANTKGRQAEAYTDSCGGAKITDEWFSYAPDGHLTDLYESTPNSGGFYHTSASYWANGAIDSLSALTSTGTAIFPTIYYGTSTGAGLDGEGRIKKVFAATGVNPVTSTTYNLSGGANPIGALLSVTLGSGDIDSFTFDPKTGRPLTSTFAVNGVNDTDTLTWNTNGTLGTLAIADSLAGTTDSQTCNYFYDDLARLAGKNSNGYSADCGSKWQQLFSLDPFGNITKTGSFAFVATYSSTTNHVTNLSFTYDLNGKVLTDDVSNTYTWDPNWDNPASINSTNLIYDALGRMVEQKNGSNYMQVLYSPVGKTAIMSAQNLTKAFIGLPGGGTAIYTSSGLSYYRHPDWLGSSRLTSTSARGVYSTTAYAPFGEQYAKSGTVDASFTGQNADTTSTLYDFTFRENSPTQGRWISPDPAGSGAVDLTTPQSWNRYAYVADNPLSMVDPMGLDYCLDQDGNETGASDDWTCSGGGGTWVSALPTNPPDVVVTATPLSACDYSCDPNSITSSIVYNLSYARDFTTSLVSGFSVRFDPKDPSSCISVALDSYKPIVNGAKKIIDYSKNYAAPLVASLPGQGANLSQLIYSSVKWGADKQNALEMSGAVSAVTTFVATQGQTAVNAVANAARNPYVMLAAADAALLYGVTKEGVAAYQGKCR